MTVFEALHQPQSHFVHQLHFNLASGDTYYSRSWHVPHCMIVKGAQCNSRYIAKTCSFVSCTKESLKQQRSRYSIAASNHTWNWQGLFVQDMQALQPLRSAGAVDCCCLLSPLLVTCLCFESIHSAWCINTNLSTPDWMQRAAAVVQ